MENLVIVLLYFKMFSRCADLAISNQEAFEGTVMQIEKALINDRLHVSVKFAIFNSSLTFNSFYCLFCL